ncbi:MAG: HAD family phosphatase [Erysipelothrix sp.]|nr:HAD family phosphatase [Erysipelothrix sp.]
MKKILFIFDMDGLLVNTEEIYQNCWQKTFLSENLKVSEEECKKLVGMGTQLAEDYFEKLFNDRNEYWRLRAIREIFFWQWVDEHGISIKDGVLNVLNWCKNQGYRTALATSTARQRSLHLLKIAGIDFNFDYQGFGDEVANTKPDPEILINILNQANVNNEDAIIFEDSANGLLAAYNAGIDVVWVKDVAEIGLDLQIIPIMTLDRIDEVIKKVERIA